MRVSDIAQRDLKQWRVDELVANFDPEKLGVLVVSKRDGWHWIIDGQHRVAVLRAIGWGDQMAQAEIYEGLTEAQEAEMFLGRNDNLAVTALAKFKVAVVAGRPDQVTIDKIVRGSELSIGGGAGQISAVGTITRIYERLGADILARTLPIVRDAYGNPGLEGPVIEAVAMVLSRYGDDVGDETATHRLKTARGGVGAILTAAEQLRTTTGLAKQQCIAASIVTAYNRGRGGKKLAPWFRAAEVA